MTRKDFQLIAEVLRDSTAIGSDFEHAALCRDFARALATTNPRFDKEKFLRACGHGPS